MIKYLDPKNDVVFKKIFGQHSQLLISFLNALLHFEDDAVVESIECLQSELVPPNPMKKNSIVDVRCKDNNGRHFIVEMQMEWVAAFLQRMLFNAAKIYGNQINGGEHYIKLQPVYALAILTENFDDKTESYYHQFEMLNGENTAEKIEGLTVIQIELQKFLPHTKKEKELAVLWLRFLKEIGEQTETVSHEFINNAEISKALEICHEGAFTESEMFEYDKNWDAISIEKTLFVGKYLEGKAKGIAIGKAEIVLNAHKMNLPVEQIQLLTGLTIAEIENIIKQ